MVSSFSIEVDGDIANKQTGLKWAFAEAEVFAMLNNINIGNNKVVRISVTIEDNIEHE